MLPRSKPHSQAVATSFCSRKAGLPSANKMVRFSVSAELGMPAHLFFVERDSAAFRSLVAKVELKTTLTDFPRSYPSGILYLKVWPVLRCLFEIGDEAWGIGHC